MLEIFLKKLSDTFTQMQPQITHPCNSPLLGEKQLYATMLATTIAANGKIEKQQSILFGILLKAMGLKNKQRESFLLAEEITSNDIKIFSQLLSKHQLRLHFIADILMLFRIDNPLLEEQITLLNYWANLLHISEDEINSILFIISKCLKIDIELNECPDNNYLQENLSYWVKQIELLEG